MKLSYNSHYVIASEMFYYPEVHTIFEYLMDQLADLEYQAAIDKKTKRWLEDNPDTIKVSISKILKRFAIGKNRVPQIFQWLEDMKLIVCARANNKRIQTCTINRPLYYSVIQFFKQLDEEDRVKFSEDLYIKEGLSKYSIPKLSDAEVYAEENKPIAKLPKKGDSVCKTPEIGSFDSAISRNREIDTPKLPVEGEIMLPNTPSIVSFIEQNSLKRELSDEIYSISPEFWDAHAEETDVEVFLSDPNLFLEEYPTFRAPLLGHFMLLKLPLQGDSAPQNSLYREIRPPYINNNKENSDNERSEALVEIELGVKGEEEKLSGDESCLDLTKVEVVDLINQEESTLRLSSTTPFFNIDEIDEIVSSVDKAKQNPFWLFLYNFWSLASNIIELHEDPDDEEEGEPIEKPFKDPEGEHLSVSEFNSCKKKAYAQTLSEIKNKKLEDFDDQIDFQPEDLFSEKLMSKIFDWNHHALIAGENYIVVNKARIRNIEADKIVPLQHPQSRCEKRAAASTGKILMRKLYIAKHDAKLYSQLTRIEKIAADIIDDYYKPNPEDDESSPFVFKSTEVLYKEDWRKIKRNLDEQHLTVEDLIASFIDNKGPDEETLQLKRVMFYTEGIRFVNSKYNETSILDSIEVD